MPPTYAAYMLPCMVSLLAGVIINVQWSAIGVQVLFVHQHFAASMAALLADATTGQVRQTWS